MIVTGQVTVINTRYETEIPEKEGNVFVILWSCGTGTQGIPSLHFYRATALCLGSGRYERWQHPLRTRQRLGMMMTSFLLLPGGHVGEDAKD